MFVSPRARSIGARCFGVTGKIEDVNNAYPNRLALERRTYWYRSAKCSRTDVLGFGNAHERVQTGFVHRGLAYAVATAT